MLELAPALVTQDTPRAAAPSLSPANTALKGMQLRSWSCNLQQSLGAGSPQSPEPAALPARGTLRSELRVPSGAWNGPGPDSRVRLGKAKPMGARSRVLCSAVCVF